jgi:light-regulated signal transduction histidine kinase (bacteriophytochrome)
MTQDFHIEALPVTARNVDLSNCDREQIHIPGAIQPHGAMLVLDAETLVVRQASANCDALLGHDPDGLIGTTPGGILGRGGEERLRILLERGDLDNGPCHVLRAGFGRDEYDVFAHSSGVTLLVEIEKVPVGTPMAVDLFSDLRAAISGLQATTSLQAFFDLAVEQIRRFTGFDVVLAYKFQEDGSGHVMAESKPPHIESYLGLHYPASDIPAPARRLFGMSGLRHLPDVDYAPAPLLPNLGRDDPPVDMSRAFLRSVSEMYTGYLRNMGVKATMVMPLMKDGALWGLVSAMNHVEPLHLSYETRMAAEFLAQMISLLMSDKEKAESAEERLRMAATLDQLIKDLRWPPDLRAILTRTDDRPNLLSFLDAQGAAVASVHDGAAAVGNTPDRAQLLALVTWLAERGEPIFATDQLAREYPPAADFADCASGLLAARLSPRRAEFVLWFRPELPQIVNWAGDPGKPCDIDVSTGEARLTPRASFALWQETAYQRSRPWTSAEVQGAEDLRRALIHDENPNRAQREAARAKFAHLTSRENDILAGLLMGKINKTIAYDLGISVRTTEAHRSNLMMKVGAATLSDLIRMALLAATGAADV